jgi:hypothetical protein
MHAVYTEHQNIFQVQARDEYWAAEARRCKPAVGRSDDDDASDTAAVAESDEADKADPSTCSEDDAGKQETVPPALPIEVTQDFKAQHAQNGIRTRIRQKTRPNIHTRPPSVKQ